MLSIRDSRLHLLLITGALVLIGLSFAYSVGSVQAARIHKPEIYFLLKQLVGCAAGLALLFAAYKTPLEFYRRYIAPLCLFTLALLIAVFFQRKIGGAHRWLLLPVFSFQPSEMAKFTVVVYLAHYLDKKYDRLYEFSKGFLPPIILVGGLTALILLEPDFGTTFLIVLVAFTMFLVGGARPRHIWGVVAFMTPIFLASLFMGYRRERFISFLDPWADSGGAGYQLTQSYIAVGSGGFFGKGPGASVQKLFYLPESHTDFVFAILAEEAGTLGALFVVVLIALFFRIAARAALKNTDRYKRLLLLGVSCMLFYQSVINIFVVLGYLPTKGITLPFISYGGSAIMVSLFFVGILLRGVEEGESLSRP